MSTMPIVAAEGETPIFLPGEQVRVCVRFPIGHFVEAVIEPAAVNNEEEGYGRNAGFRRQYYRIAIPMTELWPAYTGSAKDGLRIEVFETWLERI